LVSICLRKPLWICVFFLDFCSQLNHRGCRIANMLAFSRYLNLHRMQSHNVRFRSCHYLWSSWFKTTRRSKRKFRLYLRVHKVKKTITSRFSLNLGNLLCLFHLEISKGSCQFWWNFLRRSHRISHPFLRNSALCRVMARLYHRQCSSLCL